MKRCPKCKIHKSKCEFSKSNARKDGLQGYCKACKKAQFYKWAKENKERFNCILKKSRKKRIELYAEYKKGLKCQECGESHLACLEHHHRNPDDKEFQIGHAAGNSSMKRLMKEIAKCDVLCTNCHRKLHYNLKEK